MGQCLKCFSIWPWSGNDKLRERHVILCNQLRYLNNMLELLNQRHAQAEIESSRFLTERAAKESGYLDQINALENRLHQQNVIMQQYQIYENNYHNDRQIVAELQRELAELKQNNNTVPEEQPYQ